MISITFNPIDILTQVIFESTLPAFLSIKSILVAYTYILLSCEYAANENLISIVCYRSDLMQQFFLTKTETLKKVHWDDVLKNNDHYDFLFNAKRNGLRLVTCTDIKVLHNKKVKGTCHSTQ